MKSVPAQEFRIRQAFPNDFNALLDFYLKNRSEELPLPATKSVGEAIGQSRILVVEPLDASTFVASAAVFQMTPQNAKTYVGELAGMRATGRVGGLQPITTQIALLGLRILGFVAHEATTPSIGATNSLLAIVKKGNLPSIQNLELAQMKPLDSRAGWIKFDEAGWHGKVITDEWKYYYADNRTVITLLNLLGPALFEGKLLLHRVNRETKLKEEIVFHLELNDIKLNAEDLKRIATGEWEVKLGPPPPEMAF